MRRRSQTAWERESHRGLSLDDKPKVWQPIVAADRQGDITLVYGARDTQHNNAVALRAYLQGTHDCR